ncbi:MAG: ABC transporter ATP-binding protein/permease [Deltaproteobacteria bacterium]|jgi:ATP-binding cassette subfamily B protein|nr:ABC transporter ATP-binding protein/permease [Deltaproteobacteria bacterium]
MENLELIKPYFKEHLARVSAGFLCLAACDFCQMVVPRIVGLVFDSLEQLEAGQGSPIFLLLLIILLAFIIAFTRWLWRRLVYGFTRILERDLRLKLHQKFLSLSYGWHQKNLSGDMMALATNDIESVRMAVGFGLVSLVDALVLGLSAIIFMLSINPSLSLWAFIPLPLISVLTAFFGRAIFRRLLEIQNIFGRLTETVREQLSGLKVIRAMALEKLSIREIGKLSRLYQEKNINLALLSGGFFPVMTLITNLTVALTIYIGGQKTIFGEISPGDFVAFVTYLTLLSWPMLALGITLSLIQEGLASLKRLGTAMLVNEEQTHPIKADILAPTSSFKIVFNQISFKYPSRDEWVLKDLNLTLNSALLTAVVGPTGCGKSTLSALLPALLEPTNGKLIIASIDSRKWPLDRLRALFGYVPQEGHIFTATMRYNLSFGLSNASEKALLQAAEAAALPIDKSVFPQGLDTLIGEKGLTLSGGQRQRLSLARALLIDPPYLILDNTLSAVDAQVELEIMDNLSRLRPGRGALIISHRVSSVSKCDFAVVLEDKRVSMSGEVNSLMKTNGYLKRMAELSLLGIEARHWPTKRERGR